jgi:hypothetical protein
MLIIHQQIWRSTDSARIVTIQRQEAWTKGGSTVSKIDAPSRTASASTSASIKKVGAAAAVAATLRDTKKRRDQALRTVAAQIKAKSVGVTPKWKRAIANHKAVMSQKMSG